jgi:hypothetical protein
MTKRYFYTDPLAAAWMEKRHCFRFSCDVFTTFTPAKDERLLKAVFEPYFYIHSDSLHLLEPKPDDLVQWLITDGSGKPFKGFGAVSYYEGYGKIERIIERNGIPFMWPESGGV